MIPLQCKQSTRVSRDYFKMRFDLSERIIWAGPNTMIYFHYTWKKNNYCRIHHLWIRQSVLNVDNVIVIAALLDNNLAMTSPIDALHQGSACRILKWGPDFRIPGSPALTLPVYLVRYPTVALTGVDHRNTTDKLSVRLLIRSLSNSSIIETIQ